MEKIRYFICVALMLCGFSSAQAQDEYEDDESAEVEVKKEAPAKPRRQVPTRTVKGRVVDAATGSPLAGVMVATADIDGYSTLTAEDGSYELKIPLFATSLAISAPDYNLVRKGLNGSERVADVKLFPATLRADYNAQANVTATEQTTIDHHSSAITIEEEIQKQLGGVVYSTTRSGTPGIGGVMFIGGLNSLNANAQPLVVIDGVIIDQQYNRQMIHDGFYNDVLSNLNPADIERVTVMRNGTALYGAKGSNGVILVETRRNKSMATRITASLSAGVTLEPKHIDMMSAEQYRSYASELLKTTNTTVKSFKFLNEDPTYYYYRQYHNQTDWTDKLYRTALTQNYGINVEGGDAVASYNLSLGYTNAQSTLDYNGMNRLNIRFNTDILFSRKFSARFDASFTNQQRNLRDDGTPAGYVEGTPTSPSFLGYVKSPFISPYAYVAGQISQNHLDVNDETYLDEALANYQNYNYKLANPRALNEYGDAENKNHFENSMLNVAVTPKLQLLPSLTLSEHFSYNLINTNEKYYIPIYGMPDYYVQSVADSRQNEVRSLFAKQNSLMSDTRLTWNGDFDSHRLDIVGGARVNWESYTLNGQLAYNTGNDKTPQIRKDLMNVQTNGLNDSWTNIAWYLQAQYNYLQRYYVQLNMTAETSSRFGREADGLKMADVQWGLFPGVQVGWVLTNEQWLADVKGIDYLRLSAGLDITGNDDISYHASRSYFGSHRYLDKILGLTFENIGNQRIQWETTRRLSASLEGNFIGNRLNVRLNYFNAKTSHLLTQSQLSYLTGLESNWGNGGALKNEGFDVTATARLLNTRHWQWELGASVGHYKNRLTELPAGQDYIDTEVYGATIRSQVGQPVNAFYGYKASGVFATSEEAAEAHLYVLGDNGLDRSYFQAGDMHFVDLVQDGRIDGQDRTIIGDPNPDIYGNIFTTVAYKRLRLDVNLNYSLGNDVYNYQRSQLEGGQRFMNQTLAMTQRWHGEGHTTDMPQATFQDPMGNSRFSDRWIEDGSYLKLKSVTLSYQLPVRSQFLQGLEFWVQGNNLLTLSRYLGCDPETSMTSSVIGQGIDLGLLPQSRSIVAGIKINL